MEVHQRGARPVEYYVILYWWISWWRIIWWQIYTNAEFYKCLRAGLGIYVYVWPWQDFCPALFCTFQLFHCCLTIRLTKKWCSRLFQPKRLQVKNVKTILTRLDWEPSNFDPKEGQNILHIVSGTFKNCLLPSVGILQKVPLPSIGIQEVAIFPVFQFGRCCASGIKFSAPSKYPGKYKTQVSTETMLFSGECNFLLNWPGLQTLENFSVSTPKRLWAVYIKFFIIWALTKFMHKL